MREIIEIYKKKIKVILSLYQTEISEIKTQEDIDKIKELFISNNSGNVDVKCLEVALTELFNIK